MRPSIRFSPTEPRCEDGPLCRYPTTSVSNEQRWDGMDKEMTRSHRLHLVTHIIDGDEGPRWDRLTRR